jgi:uncharacterized membrane protein
MNKGAGLSRTAIIQEDITVSQNGQPNRNNKHLQNKLKANQDIIRSLKERLDEKRSTSERLADFLTASFGSMGFLIINVAWFALWIVINLGMIPAIPVFDPFPFGLLTMIVSLEAIGLAIIVLISQNRSSKIADLREEIDLQIDMLTEREITKLMHIVSAIAEKQGIDLKADKELQTMLDPTSTSKIEDTLEKQVWGELGQGSESQET